MRINKQADMNELIKALNLTPHPEGGYFTETYRSAGAIAASALPPTFGGDRCYATSILYLLPEGEKSHFHRIKQDEVWHFHLGGALRLVMILDSGEAREITLGSDVPRQYLQYAVPAGAWFAATPKPGAGYCLVGCTVAPGFEFADFEMGSRAILQKTYPAHYGLISEFALSDQ